MIGKNTLSYSMNPPAFRSNRAKNIQSYKIDWVKLEIYIFQNTGKGIPPNYCVTVPLSLGLEKKIRFVNFIIFLEFLLTTLCAYH
jgi:hypothetical protein